MEISICPVGMVRKVSEIGVNQILTYLTEIRYIIII